ncbi:MAG: NHL repeat-containing protein [Chloroflexi bacterium]|nr:NHL repeat-containing protein [Chloroflexota bacterium]
MSEITLAPGRCWQYSHYVGRRATAGMGFSQPVGVAAGKDGVLFVANRASPRITKATIDQDFISEFGRGGDEQGQFTWLTAIVLDQDERVYVADEWLNRITIFDADGNLLNTWGEAGDGEGQLNGPSGLAFDADDNIWIVNSLNSRVQKFTKDGNHLGGFGVKGSAEGELDMPWGITIDNDGDVYIADWNNHRVQKFSTGGTHLRTFGSGIPTGVSPDGGTPYMHATVREIEANPNDLNHPTGVAVDGEGDVYVVDWMNERVVIFNAEGNTMATLRGEARGLSKWAEMSINSNPDMGLARRRVKNPEVQNYFRMPVACIFDQPTNRLIVCDTHRGRLQIYEKDTGYHDPQFNL